MWAWYTTKDTKGYCELKIGDIITKKKQTHRVENKLVVTSVEREEGEG